jgi:hypothetical protein
VAVNSHRLPAIYFTSLFASGGGSYGADLAPVVSDRGLCRSHSSRLKAW